MADIFISYSQKDRATAEAIAGAFEAVGYTVWWDQKLVALTDWRKQTNDEISNAKCVIVIWSEAAAKSQFVVSEAGLADARGVLIPVVIDNVRPPTEFVQIKSVDLKAWAGQTDSPEFRRLIEQVRRKVGKAPEKSSPDIIAWAAAQATNVASAYDEFVAKFPDSPFVVEARRRISGGNATPKVGRVFLSYRRDDTQAVARLIYERLSLKLGEDNIFFDVTSITPGVLFDERIQERLIQCSTVLAIIGGSWLGRRPLQPPRIRSSRDFVRRELELAFKHGIRVIPVLVTPHDLPKTSDLPKSLKRLRAIQAAELSLGMDYPQHIDRIVEAVRS